MVMGDYPGEGIGVKGFTSDRGSIPKEPPETPSPVCIPGLGTSGILKEESCEADLGMTPAAAAAAAEEEEEDEPSILAAARSSSLNLNKKALKIRSDPCTFFNSQTKGTRTCVAQK